MTPEFIATVSLRRDGGWSKDPKGKIWPRRGRGTVWIGQEERGVGIGAGGDEGRLRVGDGGSVLTGEEERE